MLEKVIENWTSRLDYIRASRGSPMPEIIFKIRELVAGVSVVVSSPCAALKTRRVERLMHVKSVVAQCPPLAWRVNLERPLPKRFGDSLNTSKTHTQGLPQPPSPPPHNKLPPPGENSYPVIPEYDSTCLGRERRVLNKIWKSQWWFRKRIPHQAASRLN
ncbi:hypothetical protein TNCV_71281 [Trichonephila clavipes]|nr:hypothetical protein TNCV_71281 [Trichonephila clavipes]